MDNKFIEEKKKKPPLPSRIVHIINDFWFNEAEGMTEEGIRIELIKRVVEYHEQALKEREEELGKRALARLEKVVAEAKTRDVTTISITLLKDLLTNQNEDHKKGGD